MSVFPSVPCTGALSLGAERDEWIDAHRRLDHIGGFRVCFSPARSSTLTTAVGYRAGFITGYDERFFGIGDKLPVLPFAQFVAGINVRNLGIELAYAGIVASVSLNWRL